MTIALAQITICSDWRALTVCGHYPKEYVEGTATDNPPNRVPHHRVHDEKTSRISKDEPRRGLRGPRVASMKNAT
jgi:hypothetical protein